MRRLVGATHERQSEREYSECNLHDDLLKAGTSGITCAHPPDVCCIAYGTAARSCVPAAACAGTPLACAGASDCPSGQTCCGAYNRAAKRYDAVACATSCTRSNEVGFDVAFCALRNGDADCPAGQRCIASMVYAGFAVCG